MEKRTYHLTGTIVELQELLQSQFNLEEKAAKFSACLLIMDQQQAVDELNETNAALWYLNSREHYTTPIFHSRFSIFFTDTKRSILDQLFRQFGEVVAGKDASVLGVILGCLLAVYRNSTFIKAEECCVYYHALSWKATHASQEYFQVRDILPNTFEGVCEHLDLIKDGKWKCYSCHGENCDVSESRFSTILDGLCERKVLNKYNKMYRFTK